MKYFWNRLHAINVLLSGFRALRHCALQCRDAGLTDSARLFARQARDAYQLARDWDKPEHITKNIVLEYQ